MRSGHRVEQVAVVADQEQRARVAAQVRLEPGDRLEVEVVGRLVEQHQVRLGEQDRGQRHPHPPAARERGERERLCRLVEAQALEDRGGSRGRGIRADRGEAVVDLAQAGGVDAGRRRLGQQPRALLVGGEDGLDRRGLAARRLLCHHADPCARPEPHGARVGLGLARDEAEQGRLAGAVAADEAHALPGRQVQRGALQERAPSDAERDVVQVEHGHGL
jgi:hypothetical protein